MAVNVRSTRAKNAFFATLGETIRPRAAGDLELDVNSVPETVPREDEIDREKLQKVLDELPPNYRLVLTMFYFEDCSYREIAEQLDLPMGTVMSRLARAKGHLRSA